MKLYFKLTFYAKTDKVAEEHHRPLTRAEEEIWNRSFKRSMFFAIVISRG